MKIFNKKSKILVCVVVIVLLGTIVLGMVYGGNNWFNDSPESDAYLFPLTPDNNPEEWKSLKSHNEMLAVLQIPDDILNNMSTDGLVETCINYPMFGNIILFNSIQQGFDRVKDGFNGIQELMKRKDAGEKLLDLYKSIDLKELKLSDKYSSLRLYFVEMLLAQEDIILSLSPSQRKELVNACVEKSKLIQEKYANSFITNTNTLIIGRILLNDSADFVEIINNNDNVKMFLEKGLLINPDEKTKDDIKNILESYLNENNK